MSKKDLESMSIEELAVEVSKVYKELNFHLKKIKILQKIIIDWKNSTPPPIS